MDRWAVQVLSNHPDNFLDSGWAVRFDDDRVGRAGRPLADCLDPAKDATLVLKSKELIPRLPPEYKLGLRLGSYYVLPPTPERCSFAVRSRGAPIAERVGANFGNAVALLGYSLEPAALPQAIAFTFEFTGPEPGDYSVDLRVVRVGSDDILFQTAYPLLRRDWLLAGDGPNGRRFQDTLAFWRAFDFPVGGVFVDLRILDGTGMPLPVMDQGRGTVVKMGPIQLTPGKREVIKQALRGRLPSPRTLVTALLLL